MEAVKPYGVRWESPVWSHKGMTGFLTGPLNGAFLYNGTTERRAPSANQAMGKFYVKTFEKRGAKLGRDA